MDDQAETKQLLGQNEKGAASRSPEGSDAPVSCRTVCTRMIDCLAEASGKQLDPPRRATSETDCIGKCEAADQETRQRVRACLEKATCDAFADCVEAIEIPQP